MSESDNSEGDGSFLYMDVGRFMDTTMENPSADSTSSEPGEITQSRRSNALRLTTTPKVKGEQIAKIVSNKWFVLASAGILDVAADLTENADIQAVGVIDDSGAPIGIVVREELFNLLGRPFGREILGKQKVSAVGMKTATFRWDENIFSVGETLDNAIKNTNVMYYLASGADGKYAGIFSTRDLLIYFADVSRQDMALAKRIQSRIVKEYDRSVEKGLDFVASSIPAKGVGGDFYALKRYGAEKWMICVCDVSGKGIAASIISSVLSGITASYDFREGLFGYLKMLNAFLYESFNLEKFVTGVFADYDASTGEAKIFDLGHSHVFLFRNGSLMRLEGESKNLPLGVTESILPKDFLVRMNPGDILLLVSDGVVEQCDHSGKEYETTRLASVLKSGKGLDLGSLKVRILEDFHEFRKGVPQHDDVTLVMVSSRASSGDSC